MSHIHSRNMAERKSKTIKFGTEKPKLPNFPTYTFPGITIENFWKHVMSKQNGEFQRSELQLKLEFAVIREKLRINDPPFSTSALNELASYVIHRVNSYKMERGIPMGAEASSSQATDTNVPERCLTPKHKRTCMECNVYIDDITFDQNCEHCSDMLHDYCQQ